MVNAIATMKGRVAGDRDNRLVIIGSDGKEYLSKIRLATTSIELYKTAGMASFVVDKNGFADKLNKETTPEIKSDLIRKR